MLLLRFFATPRRELNMMPTVWREWRVEERAIQLMIFFRCSSVEVAEVEEVVVVLRKERTLFIVSKHLWKIYTMEKLFVLPSPETSLAWTAKVAVVKSVPRSPVPSAVVAESKYLFVRLAPAWFSRCRVLAVAARAPERLCLRRTSARLARATKCTKTARCLR